MSRKKKLARVGLAAESLEPATAVPFCAVPANWDRMPQRLAKNASIPGIYSGVIVVDGEERPRHYRAVAEGNNLLLEEMTADVARELVERSQDAMRRAEENRLALVAKANSQTPERLRVERGDVTREGTMLAGVTRGRALTSLDTLQRRHLLTMRQFEAGDRLAQDVKTMAGAREARDDAAPAFSPIDGRAWEDYAVIAGQNVEMARRVCVELPFYEGVGLWSVVEDVVIRDMSLTDAAGGTSRSVQGRTKTALRIALDAIGDVYRLPTSVMRTRITSRVDDAIIPVEMVYCEDVDSVEDKDGTPRIIFRSIALKGNRWVAVAPRIEKLMDLAKKELAAHPEWFKMKDCGATA